MNYIFIISILEIIIYIAYCQGIQQVDTKTNQIVDSQGRQRIYHGVNVVAKEFPYRPLIGEFDGCTTFGEEDLIILRDLGQNVLRLGVMWEGVYPQDGVVNSTYLDYMENLINLAGEYGIYTMIDMHQDLFSERYCGDGIPKWLIKQKDYESFAGPYFEKMTYDENGNANNCTGDWFRYYFTHSVASGFQKLYRNKDGWRDKWGDYWQTVAQRFKGNQYVIGYELINEPFAGDVFKNPSLLYPGMADLLNLQGAYDAISKRIRSEDEDHIIFFESVTWLNWFHSKFRHPPGGHKYANRSVFSYHYYYPPDLDMEKSLKQREKDRQKLKVGGLLSEFFIWTSQHGVSTFPEESIKLLDICDNMFQGWMGWRYKPFKKCSKEARSVEGIFYGNGTIVPEIAQNITRTYAQAIAGKGQLMSFDIQTGEFKLDYNVCINCGKTIIYANQTYHYPNGYQINIEPKNGLYFNERSHGILEFFPNKQKLQEGDLVKINIVRKQQNNK